MLHQFIQGKNKNLFSVYHEPSVLRHCDTGVVLCYPYGQEYIRCHRLYVNLANRLAGMGFHVLRFDYQGTGDSGGDFLSVTLQQSLDDIDLVIEQFRESCGLSRVALFGVRLGATLALLHSKRASVDALVLWNPVLDGAGYLKGIDQSYKKWLSGAFAKEKDKHKDTMESFGFQFSGNLVKELTALSLHHTDLKRDLPVLFFDTEAWPTAASRWLFEKSITPEYWNKRDDEFDKAMVPIHETNKTLDWLNNIAWQ